VEVSLVRAGIHRQRATIAPPPEPSRAPRKRPANARVLVRFATRRMSEPTEESLPRLLGGRYRLEAKLGHGGMGVVYRATDLTMKRQIAVKLIRGAEGAPLDDEIAGRFLREAKNTARIQHEN